MSNLQRGLSKRTYISGRGDIVMTACSAAGVNRLFICIQLSQLVCVCVCVCVCERERERKCVCV